MTDAEVRAVRAGARLDTAARAREAAENEYAAASMEHRRAWDSLPKATAERLTRACRVELERERIEARP